MFMPLTRLEHWGPFRLDALGLVTLLGADEVARAVGTLSPNGLTDFMPLLGAYRIAGNQFVAVEAGYTMYNLSDGITNTEFSAWFTRWLSQYVGEHAALDLDIVGEERTDSNGLVTLSVVLGTLAHMSMLVFAAVQADWWGVANATALFVATCVRNYLIRANRDMYNKKILKQIKKEKNGQLAKPLELERSEKKKVLIVRPDGTLVVMHIPLGLLMTLFGKLDPSATSFFSKRWNGMYTVARGVGWLSFGVHIVTIGQAYLTSQILAVGIMAAATVLTIFNIGTQQRPRLPARFRRLKIDKLDRETGKANKICGPHAVLHYDLGRWLTIKVLTLEGRSPRPTLKASARNNVLASSEPHHNSTPPQVPPEQCQNTGTVVSRYLKKAGKLIQQRTQIKRLAEEHREVGRREWYASLVPDKTQQSWMRDWHLIALEPNEEWYKDWYDFLKGWKADRKCKGQVAAWDQVSEFLHLTDQELDSLWLGSMIREAGVDGAQNESPAISTTVSGPGLAHSQLLSNSAQSSVQATAGAGPNISST
jgi:hypothetical protein